MALSEDQHLQYKSTKYVDFFFPVKGKHGFFFCHHMLPCRCPYLAGLMHNPVISCLMLPLDVSCLLLLLCVAVLSRIERQRKIAIY